MQVAVLSDFNAELLSRYLAADRSAPECQVETLPYGQLYQQLGTYNAHNGDALIVWTRPEGACAGWASYLVGEDVGAAQLLQEVDDFVAALRPIAEKTGTLLIPSWVPTRLGRGLGLLDWGIGGQARLLAVMNMRLAEALDAIKGVYVLDAQRWIDAARPARDSKFWYSIKSPFTEQVFKAAAQDVKAALQAVRGKSRKLLILDLDDTMWGGIVGDDGWENLRLGGHDVVGEAHADFQRAALTLARRGIALAVVSKNDEQVALTAIDSHPEMIVKRDHLAGWRINWEDKAANIVALVDELNLGLDAAVFLDDNPTERGRVREALPQVLVPELPKSPSAYADFLRQLDCFDQAALGKEDRGRTEMYAVERTRRQAAAQFTSPQDWLRSLEIRVAIGPANDSNFKRVVQLLNKTNQVNMSTRRLTEAELAAWLDGGHDRRLSAVTVEDRFGELGLTGIVSWQSDGSGLEIVDFVLSCRAMGRQVESTMVHLAVEAARAAAKTQVKARLLPTSRNGPCLEFWQKSGFAQAEPMMFSWDASQPYPLSDAVRLEVSA